jgi:hypothetical protein
VSTPKLAVLSLTLAVLAAVASPRGHAAEKLALDRATVVVDAAEPSFVQYGVEELAAYLRELTGNEISIVGSPENAQGVRILVGTKTVERAIAEKFPAATSNEEAYGLKAVSKDGAPYVAVSGATSRGTKLALAVLMKTIELDGRSAVIPADLNVSGTPAIRKRGMHFNGWAFNSPYSFRNWSEDEWKRYLDILACQGVNLFYVWPFIEIMPVPLSPEDHAYLEECRRVVDYAQQKHGMEVWIMQCTNRVAKDRCGVADPRRRPYWRPSQEDLNPGKPDDFKRIMASREAMYRVLNNVDGVCNIDSDPGYCPGSPLSDYVKALRGFRELLDRHNLHGKQAKLVNWMWSGWGGHSETRSDTERHQRQTIQLLKAELPEPWDLIGCWGSMLSACRSEKVIKKTVFLPYGAIEGEPSYPATNMLIDSLRTQFGDVAAKYPEFEGMMGNVQTPLLQFPHVYYFTSAMFDAGCRVRSERDVLLDLCRHLYPDRQQLLADCYLALRDSDPAKTHRLADELDGLVRQDKLGRSGVLGRKLFPDRRIVAQSLVLQLNLHAARQRLVRDLTPVTSTSDCEKLLVGFFDAYLAWDTAHGWHKLWGWNQWPMEMPAGVAARLGKSLGNAPAIDGCFSRVSQALAAKHDKRAVEIGCVVPWKRAILAAVPTVATLAQKAVATASVTPNPTQYPAANANDGILTTLYWPGALTKDNTEWLQLTWDKPQTFGRVVVRFLQHPSMHGRTIRLQREIAAGRWEDFATTVIPADGAGRHAVATFQLTQLATLDKIRIVNLLDLFEVEVY